MTLYPVSDIHTPWPDAAERLTTHHELIPDGETYLDLTEWDVRHYEKMETLIAPEEEESPGAEGGSS
jgi:hypothetical protein